MGSARTSGLIGALIRCAAEFLPPPHPPPWTPMPPPSAAICVPRTRDVFEEPRLRDGTGPTCASDVVGRVRKGQEARAGHLRVVLRQPVRPHHTPSTRSTQPPSTRYPHLSILPSVPRVLATLT